jgi:asparagine synthase (glutamine-hydrolysing)
MDEQWAGYDYYSNNSNSVIQGVKSSPFRKNVLHTDFFKMAARPEYPQPFEGNILNLQYRDLFYTKIPRALRFNDRISMAYNTELREPFLDYRLVEFAFRQPLEFKIKNKVHKYLPRSISNDFLPKSIRFAPKRPLQTPQREWLGKDLKNWVIAHISALKKSKWFEGDKLEKELDLYFKGNWESSFHIWQWVNCSLLLN